MDRDDPLRELYQATIIEHGRNPRHFYPLPEPCYKAQGHNPLCGDAVELFVQMDPDQPACIGQIGFQGQGCAISMASASLMAEAVQGLSVADASALFGHFHQMLTDDHPQPEQGVDLGKLQILQGVRAFPARVKCATLAWHTLSHVLSQTGVSSGEGGDGERDNR